MEFTLDFVRIFGLALVYVAPILIFLALLIILIGLVVGRKEGWSLADAVYYACITATTVGYGDFHPRKSASKFLAIIIALIGVLLTGMVVAVGLHAASEAFKTTYSEDNVKQRIEKIEGKS
jgi:voltage-gated potassium channel